MSAVARSLADRLQGAPLPADAALAESRLREWLAESPDAVAALADHPAVRRLLLGIADQSPYLWHLIRSDPARWTAMLSGNPEQHFDDLLVRLADDAAAAATDADVMSAIRHAKASSALLIALADLGGVWSVDEVVAALTRFADAAVTHTLRFLLRQASAGGKLHLPDVDAPETGCGLVVLALGKQGAGELNYSSDIDLILFYDPAASSVPAGVEPGPLFVRLTRSLARLLSDRTHEGFGLRVDLRLRPDPGSTTVAIALPAASFYYETLGQNWERAALIKARPVAGDVALGRAFLDQLAPFIWRKYFDYAAIADIYAMKRQIHAVRGHDVVTIAGHDIKLGRGGIREIEFFVQTQQLIFGGRRPHLRGARTLDMLEALARDGWVTDEAVRDLTIAYRMLREIEHRLQMVNDEQTQRLPADAAGLERFARFCGYRDAAQFSAALTHQLRRVEAHYARLFEKAPGLDTTLGNLVFTGVVDDPDTLETLAKLGFAHPSAAIEIVRGWHFGRRAGVQSARAREILTELVPALLQSFSASGDPDAALVAFDRVLATRSAAVELLSMLRSNAALRDLFGDILGAAPRLAQIVASRPHVLDAAIDPTFAAEQDSEAGFDRRVASRVTLSGGFERALDAARDVFHEESFSVGARLLSGVLDARQAGLAFAALASAIVRALLQCVTDAFVTVHGRVAGARAIVVAMGRLGSRDMTATSDLDLMLIYDAAPIESDGPKPLHATVYYTRLTQRLISALTVATRRGLLYDVDMRLRPSGRKGPVATSLASFVAYQHEGAMTWEHMALTRARIVAGDAGLAAEVEAVITTVLRAPRDEAALRRDVVAMRDLVEREKGADDPWDLKHATGGLMDLDFLAQFWELRFGASHPAVLARHTEAVIEAALPEGLVAPEDAEVLLAAQRLYATVTQILKLTVEGVFDPAHAPAGVLRRVATAAGAPDFAFLAADLTARRHAVRRIFDRLLRNP